MKKEYVAPSAEKLTFDYTESVVASGDLVPATEPIAEPALPGQETTGTPGTPGTPGKPGPGKPGPGRP